MRICFTPEISNYFTFCAISFSLENRLFERQLIMKEYFEILKKRVQDIWSRIRVKDTCLYISPAFAKKSMHRRIIKSTLPELISGRSAFLPTLSAGPVLSSEFSPLTLLLWKCTDGRCLPFCLTGCPTVWTARLPVRPKVTDFGVFL